MNRGSEMTAEPSDEEIVERVVLGDQAAYRILVERHKNYVYTLIYRMVPQRESAEDLAQEVFLRMYRNLSRFRGESKFTTWMYRITVRIVLDYTRTQRKKTIGSLLDWIKQRFADGGEEPEQRLLHEEQRVLMRQAMDRLPEKYRLILHLFHYQQLSYHEISKVTELPLKTIETRLYRGRALLKKHWLEVQGNDEQTSE